MSGYTFSNCAIASRLLASCVDARLTRPSFLAASTMACQAASRVASEAGLCDFAAEARPVPEPEGAPADEVAGAPALQDASSNAAPAREGRTTHLSLWKQPGDDDNNVCLA